MRTQLFLGFAVGILVVGHPTASAQGPGGSGTDFFGVYAPPVFVTVPAVTEPAVYPFTAQAQEVFSAYDASRVDVDDCAAETMPGILWTGSPMELVQEDGRIMMRFEEANTIRSIHMDGAAPSPDQPHTGLGYSVGHWVGDVLTIETTQMLGGGIRRGYPLSRDARLVERYWREPGEKDLQLELLVDDPVNYTETFKLGREWIWAPDDQVLPYDCISLGPRDSEPDIDELLRILEGR